MKQQIDYRIFVIEQDGELQVVLFVSISIWYQILITAGPNLENFNPIREFCFWSMGSTLFFWNFYILFFDVGNGPFNRGKLLNVGFTEALKLRDFDCFIFHDVDLIPEDDRNLYTCPEQPRHMSVAVDKFHYA